MVGGNVHTHMTVFSRMGEKIKPHCMNIEVCRQACVVIPLHRGVLHRLKKLTIPYPTKQVSMENACRRHAPVIAMGMK